MSNMLNQNDPKDTQRLLIALLIIGLGLVAWQVLYEAPRQHAAQLQRQEEQAREQKMAAALKQQKVEASIIGRQQSEKIATSQASIRVTSDEMEGRIALQGGRINYLKLLDYNESTEENSSNVVLLQPTGIESYFIEFGWLPSNETSAVDLPTSATIWQSDKESLREGESATLWWENAQNVRFETKITLEGPYLFKIEQRVVNRSAMEIEILPYGYINRTFEGEASDFYILHEGPIGVVDGALTEMNYDDLIDDGEKRFANAEGWIGLSDKYWLTALIPHMSESFTANYKGYITKEGFHRYQTEYLGRAVTVASGTAERYETLAFAGAKKLELLDDYSEKFDIPLFDRAVDLGVLYFLTKPLLKLLVILYAFAGDFGLAIILLTLLVKAAMYPLANKSYISMNEMKRLQPKLKNLKERYGDDRMRFQQEMMAVYKKEKINPAAGCLPLIIQIPVFFALYKVLLVTIEMRHANFYGLIEDLSAMDPTNLFTGFGLLDWTPPDLMHLGIMPIMMALTMWMQQQMNPKPTDPMQAKVMGFLPWIFMVILASFPAGLLLYWICSNMLSVLQQWSIKKRYGKREKKRLASAANDE